jgi:hypothetical protein
MALTCKFYYPTRNTVDKAIHHLLDDGADLHRLDKQVKTPASIAFRSLYVFHLWHNAISRKCYLIKLLVAEGLSSR